MIFKYVFYFSVIALLVSCGDKPARRPISVKTSTFLKESAKKNKELLTQEEALIEAIIKSDSLHTYINSQHGFKYYYIVQQPDSSYTAQFGDIVTFNYSLSDLQGNIIYPKKENGYYEHHTDKEELFFGLRSALKLLKENEAGVFYFPSEIAFGYHGDQYKIGSNEPVRAEIELISIEKVSSPIPVSENQEP
ncbi:MAG: gliding motility-associated peptidyl-prolyl isomerase GldI [Capnocytophaga sp.]|nr:gliding motility-associated peptidyl-prolyl isomerase GldI [Capnocytophaga sp.]